MKKNSKGQVVARDWVGTPIGTSVVVRLEERKPNGSSSWWLRCICGTEYTAWAESLTRGSGKHCLECRKKVQAKNQTKHGHRYTRQYKIWVGARGRCKNPNHTSFSNYGGRGIKFSDAWDNYETFLSDMPPMPEGSMSIDRIDNNGNYEKGNCKWSNAREQANNRRTNTFITFEGKTLTISQWSRERDIEKSVIRQRLLKGWPVEKVLSKEKFKAVQK